jgi:hypothetical protein
MLGLSPKLPISEEERVWTDQGFARLEKMLGRSRLLEAKVILPDNTHFPDRYDRTSATVESLFRRICDYMEVDHNRIELEIFPDEEEELREILPYWRGNSGGCAGLYSREADASEGHERLLIALKASLAKDAFPLIATIAHELGHVILLGDGLIDPATPDHEPMTDLLTVFLGFGIFSANSAALFRQYQDERRHGWSMQRLGYLSQEIYGYALARFAAERGETKPLWAGHLSTNVRAYFRRSNAWLAKHGTQTRTKPIR